MPIGRDHKRKNKQKFDKHGRPITTMQVTWETRNKIATLGSYDDTFDVILNKLYDYWVSGHEEKIIIKEQPTPTKSNKANCKACLGFGVWAVGMPVPMTEQHFKDKMPCKPCPECGSGKKQ